ncbi:MAG: hypothetical protein NDJ89_14385 [Oligoflexia bacterium]|nr:hypothetical protein [Oligoflexia bacterium]
MNQNTKLESARFPRMLGELTHSNQVLKVFALLGLALALVCGGLLYVTATRPPVVLALSPSGASLEQTTLPKPEDEVREAIARYLELRYRWEPANVKQRLRGAEAFILPNSVRAYQAAVANVAKFSTEKAVAQRVYPEKIDVSLERRTAVITGDRVTAIQGLKAAGSLRLELGFESGTRSKENPWGIYVAKEREE